MTPKAATIWPIAATAVQSIAPPNLLTANAKDLIRPAMSNRGKYYTPSQQGG